MARKLSIDAELQMLGVTFGNASLPEIAEALENVGYTAARQAANYALWQKLAEQRREQLLAMGIKKELTGKVMSLRDEVYEDLRALRNLLKAIQRHHAVHDLLLRTGLQKPPTRTLGQLLTRAGVAYQVLLEHPELGAIVAQHSYTAARLNALLDKAEALKLLDREQASGKGVAQDATNDFYMGMRDLREARAALKALAALAFGPEDRQFLETLGLGPVKM